MTSIRSLTLVLFCAAAGLSGCARPPLGMPDESVIGYDGKAAIPPDCASLARPSVLVDAGRRRPSMEWGCATYTNLAAQVADPEDLVAPKALGPADAAVAAAAVRRYEIDKVAPLDASTSRNSN
jgi:pilus assembly protein CpaD